MTAAALLARRSALPVVGVIGLVVAVALIALGATGRGGFAADPVAVAALVAAAGIAGECGRRLTADGSVRAGRWTTALAASLVVYLASALVAVATTNAAAIAIWNAMWLAPLALAQLAASAAVRRERTRVREHTLVLGTTLAAAVATLLLVAPTDPFEGVPQISPESWSIVLAPIGDVVTTIGLLALLVLPVRLGRAALTSSGTARAQLGVAAAGTAGAPLTVVFCLLLAVARAPGDVDPSVGSVGFLVALASCSAVAAVCALLASRTVAPGSLLVVVRVVALAVAGLVVAGVGTLLAAPSTGLGPTVAALAVAGLAVVTVLGGWRGAAQLATTLTPPEAEPAPAPGEPRRIPDLTPRENEVLALLASGASNAGIAAQLVVSERTVDAHLRSVFGKLDLRQEPDVNRRVRAARIWFDHPV